MDLNKVKQPNESYSEFYGRTGLGVTSAVYKLKQTRIENIKKLLVDKKPYNVTNRQNNIIDLRLRKQRRTELTKLMSKMEIPRHLVKNVFKYVGYDLVESYTVTI